MEQELFQVFFELGILLLQCSQFGVFAVYGFNNKFLRLRQDFGVYLLEDAVALFQIGVLLFQVVDFVLQGTHC